MSGIRDSAGPDLVPTDVTQKGGTMRTTASVASLRPVLLSAQYPPTDYLTWIGGTIRSWDAALVEIVLDDGTTGLGEVGAGIMAAAAVPGLVAAFEPYVVNSEYQHPLEVGNHLRAYTAFWSRGGIASGVAGAIEIAVLDAVGKREGVPAYELLGGPARSRIEAYASGGVGTDFGQVEAWVEAQVEHGFRTVKFRAMKDPDTTIALARRISSRLPHGVRFVLDAVQASASHPWSIDDATTVGRVLDELDARWYEEPLGADDVDGYAELQRRLTTSVSGVESNSRVSEFQRLIEAEAVEIVQPDTTFVGGVQSFLDVATLAEARGVKAVPHVWGSGVSFAANLHASFAHPNVNLFEYCRLENPLRDALLMSDIDIDHDGFIALPQSPGLGISLTPDTELTYTYAPGAGHVIR